MRRKVILGFGISLDGYIARRNGAIDFLVLDKEGESVMADFFSGIDTTIMGRKTATGWVKMRESGEIPLQFMPPAESKGEPGGAGEEAPPRKGKRKGRVRIARQRDIATEPDSAAG